ncbi:2-amino-4-hydroxy-6-hydroxymethyldihydropteridine diphosphokinase [Brevundimonas sp.]|uniref:2-amino-4-hydroxy-6- hydroxymethyldihydropteridine diphosphokinase n=1 Tax=Brevundimonas sp. TaxID=1871086 RepID=UPI001D38A9D8|nr:2-amino-4-hydroxy-6-hydroxymethyldihydropteridine diphosphokinase [Brevundimonas sp.]MBL0947143.1 2-amino-4-hydroxy-6-hydroxymethyldihydropteridine diphosphokinase [Brevundimonas sp.]
MNTPVIIALGSNDKGSWTDIGALLGAAVHDLESAGVNDLRRSRWWRSSAWPNPGDPAFLNGVVRGRWDGTAAELMATLAGIEDRYGRRRAERNAPRTLDLDLIDFGGEIREEADLVLPHPRAAERLFVMGPLAEVAPDWRDPVSGRPVSELAGTARIGCDAVPLDDQTPHSCRCGVAQSG